MVCLLCIYEDKGGEKMLKQRAKNCSLRIKIGGLVIVTAVVVLAILSALNIFRETASVQKTLENKGYAVLYSQENLAKSAVESNNFELLRENFKNVITRDSEFRYLVLVDKDGKAVVHSDISREGRVFNDAVGAKAAAATEPLVQNYKRDTGEKLVDVTLPVVIDGKHWGALRVGIPLTEIDKARNNIIYWNVIAGVIIIVISIGISLVFVRSLVRPIVKLAQRAKVVADGDLSEDIDVECDDEIGYLAGAFNQMIFSMRGMISELVAATSDVAERGKLLASNAERGSQAADSIASAIGQVAAESERQYRSTVGAVSVISDMTVSLNQLALSTGDQSKTVELTSDILNQMAVSIQDVAVSAQAVSEAAQQTSDAAHSGGQAVRLSIQGMQKIRDKVFETAVRIKELGESSAQIGEIIQVIDEIAEQTNLLALNAAIEAARAGEHGKGFAVVADEVRKLAERSGKATKEIADLINNIQKGTEKAVEAMEEGTREVEQGANIAEDAGKALDNILRTVEKTYDQVQSISAAAEEISASSFEVVKAMENVAEITQKSTASTEELAAGSTEVHAAINAVSEAANENASAVEEIVSSSEEMADVSRGISNDAQFLAETSENLSEMVSRFIVKKITARCWDVMGCPSDSRARCSAFNNEEKRCWLLEGTWCGGAKQGDAKSKRQRCMNCPYFKENLN